MTQNQKAGQALPCSVGQPKINSRVIIPRDSYFRPICLWGYIGKVSVFRQALRAQKVLLDVGYLPS